MSDFGDDDVDEIGKVTGRDGSPLSLKPDVVRYPDGTWDWVDAEGNVLDPDSPELEGVEPPDDLQ